MDWKPFVPQRELAAWHQFDAGESGNNIIFDKSGNARHISTDINNSPQIFANVLGKNPAWYFDGTRLPLKFSGNLSVQHLFVCVAISTATFIQVEGVLSSLTQDVLVGGGGGTTQFYNLQMSAGYEYRKSDVIFSQNNQQSPMSNNFAIIELSFPSSQVWDGIQIGQNTLHGDKLHGFFVENLMYSSTRNIEERRQIYEYFALRYHLWRKTETGLNIFPFDPNYPMPVSAVEKMFTSEAVSGLVTSRSKQSVKRLYKANFQDADQYELIAAGSFCDSHRDNNQALIIEDKTFTPAAMIPVKTYSRVDYEATDAGNFNYSVQFKEI